MNNKFTIVDLLNNNVIDEENKPINIEKGVEIPMIQRDYAQGRKDKKTSYIRENFLKDIYSVLSNKEDNAELNLDFIYGYVENKTFIPLDGQQRITTLFIIYWFLAFKDKALQSSDFFKNFSYTTRQSSKEFLKNLNNSDNISKLFEESVIVQKEVSSQIKEQPWFSKQWLFDPTVVGFLETLKSVEIKFKEIKYVNILNNAAVNFHILRIEDYGLGDNLYIKMNARGKPLSDFEKFKATFEKIVSKHKNFKEFSFSIDGKWLNYFWFYAKTCIEKTEDENVKILSQLSDKFLYNFIAKITEYLFHSGNVNSSYEFTEDIIENVYSNEDNFNLLIDFFNIITAVPFTEYESYFAELFSENYSSQKIAIHQKPFNFLVNLIEGETFTNFQNIILFAWLNFISRTKTSEKSNNLLDFLRITRNVANNINQKNKTTLDTELRNDDYNNILEFVKTISVENPYSSLIAEDKVPYKKYIQYEIAKYQYFKNSDILKSLLFEFEDYSELKGLIFNFDFSDYTETELKNIVKNFQNLFSTVNYKDIIRLLLCYNNYSVKIISDSNFGAFRFLGSSKKWHRVLSSPEGEVKENFKEMLPLLRNEIISNWVHFIEGQVAIKKLDYDDSWLAYVFKPEYKVILDLPVYTSYNQKDSLRCVEIYNVDKPSLNAFHYNPFVYYFRWHSALNIQELLDRPECCAQYTNLSFLQLKNGIKLQQIDKRWYIHKAEITPGENRNIYFDTDKNLFYCKCADLIADVIPVIEYLSKKKKPND